MPDDLKTPPAPTDDGAASASATDSGAVSDAEQGETGEQRIARIEKERDDAMALSKSLKSSGEEANALREENRNLKAKLEPAPTTDAIPPAIADLVPDIQELDAQIARYTGQEENRDYVAGLRATRKALALQAQSRLQDASRAQLWTNVLMKVTDEKDRNLVFALVSSGRAGTIEDALDSIRGKRLPDLEKENADLKKQIEDSKKAERLRGVDITTRGVSAEEHARRSMPLAEWTREWDAAKERGDRKRMDELRKVAAK